MDESCCSGGCKGDPPCFHEPSDRDEPFIDDSCSHDPSDIGDAGSDIGDIGDPGRPESCTDAPCTDWDVH